MSTFRAVPRYPPPTTEDYAGWLADGPDVVEVTDEKGSIRGFGHKSVWWVIDIIRGKDSEGYIQANDFPDERIFFSYKKWPLNTRRQRLVGRRVRFDIFKTEYDPGLKAKAVNVVLV